MIQGRLSGALTSVCLPAVREVAGIAQGRPHGGLLVTLSDIDRSLLERCLAHKPRAWEDFVDRFMGLVVHVINHTAQCRSVRISPDDREDLTAEVFLALVHDDLAVLRRFRGQSSLATYLTVVARRVVVHKLLTRKATSPLGDAAAEVAHRSDEPEARLSNQEEVQRLLGELKGTEAKVVRMYHLEGKSYQEISSTVGMSEGSIGPMLSRARSKMRRAGADQTTG